MSETETPPKVETILAKHFRAQAQRHLWTAIFADTIQIALFPLVLYWQGYVVSTLWGWFAQPVTHITLSIYFAVGFNLIGRVALRSPLWTKKQSILVPAIILVIGWCWRFLGWGL